jgi:patatin-like phospholipase/acyl hydrolase
LFSSQQEDALLSILLEIEHQQNNMPSKFMSNSTQFFDSHIGMVRIKTEPEVSMYELFENRNVLESFAPPVSASFFAIKFSQSNK